jgi:hypothetical protein
MFHLKNRPDFFCLASRLVLSGKYCISDQAADRNTQITGNDKYIFFLQSASRPALGPNLPLIQMVSRTLSWGREWPRSEADHSYLVPSLRLGGAILTLCRMPTSRIHLATLYTARCAKAPSDRMSTEMTWHGSRH